MGSPRRYTDEQLVAAVAASVSWRGVLRELGLSGTSAAAMRLVRGHSERLGLDFSHFRGQRGWTEQDLRVAVGAAHSWAEVVDFLGLRGGSAVASARGHAARLGLETAHLIPAPPDPIDTGLRPNSAHLHQAGSLLAAAWFALCGGQVSWPLEPSRYDLLVDGPGGVRRVQVKTTTVRAGKTWRVYLSTTGAGRRTYDPDEIDDFFIIDGELNYYLIPVEAVGGLHMIHLAPYGQYRLAQGFGDSSVTAMRRAG